MQLARAIALLPLVTLGCGFRHAKAVAAPPPPQSSIYLAEKRVASSHDREESEEMVVQSAGAPTADFEAAAIDGEPAAPQGMANAAQQVPVPASGAVAVVQPPEKLVVEGWMRVEVDDVVATARE